MFPDNIDHGDGGIPRRFTRALGEERVLMTMSGGWRTTAVEVFSSDVGIVEAPWP